MNLERPLNDEFPNCGICGKVCPRNDCVSLYQTKEGEGKRESYCSEECIQEGNKIYHGCAICGEKADTLSISETEFCHSCSDCTQYLPSNSKSFLLELCHTCKKMYQMGRNSQSFQVVYRTEDKKEVSRTYCSSGCMSCSTNEGRRCVVCGKRASGSFVSQNANLKLSTVIFCCADECKSYLLEGRKCPVYNLGVNTSCSTCKKDGAEKVCGRCKKNRYCSVECQKKDWKNHKTTCIPLNRV